ncbi:hypothetical protein EHRUM1_01610, partial [Ehrlichia ruminantium]
FNFFLLSTLEIDDTRFNSSISDMILVLSILE